MAKNQNTFSNAILYDFQTLSIVIKRGGKYEEKHHKTISMKQTLKEMFDTARSVFTVTCKSIGTKELCRRISNRSERISNRFPIALNFQ